MKASLIISTYNRPDALRLCLLSAFGQKMLPAEIIVGDDGSSDETRRVIDELRPLSPVPLVHVWHEDKGFRLAMMRNKCVAAATGDYIIEIDGDIIMHPLFVYDHCNFAREGFYLKGGRANLGRALTARLCGGGVLRPIRFWTRGIESKRANTLHLAPLARYLSSRYRRKRGLSLGCNMSFFRKDFIAINGYDEYFEGWGGEDGDFARRLGLYGLTKRHLKFAGLVYHLWHEDKFMYNKDENIRYSIREDCPVRCARGVDQYLPADEIK